MSRRTVQRRIRKIGVSHFEKFVTGCNEKADELAKAGEMLYEGLMAEARAKTEKQEREKNVCSLAVRSQLSLFSGRMERL